jgi:hypothetical protein
MKQILKTERGMAMSVPATLEQNVKERVKAIIGEMIPEELWDKLVKDNVNEFTRVDLPKLVRAELTEHYKTIIRNELNTLEWSARWENNRQVCSEMVKEIIVGAAPDILAGMIGMIAQQVISNIQSQIQSRY